MKYTVYLHLQSFSNILLNKINISFIKSNNNLNIVRMPIKKKSFTVLRSPHVDKKSRDQFELRNYKRIIKIRTNSFSREYLTDLVNKIPAGVGFCYTLHISNH